MQVKVCNGGPAKAPGLTELRGCTVALWEALWRGKPSGRGGHDVRREWRGRWWGSSSCRGWSVATWKAGHRVRDSMAHTSPPAQTQVPALWIPFPYQLPVLLAPTFLNRKTKRRWCCVSPTSGLGDKPCAQSTWQSPPRAPLADTGRTPLGTHQNGPCDVPRTLDISTVLALPILPEVACKKSLRVTWPWLFNITSRLDRGDANRPRTWVHVWDLRPGWLQAKHGPFPCCRRSVWSQLSVSL